MIEETDKFVTELSRQYISPVVASFLLSAQLCLVTLYSDDNVSDIRPLLLDYDPGTWWKRS